jgi:hypothetical protein
MDHPPQKPCAHHSPPGEAGAGSFAFGPFVLVPDRRLLLDDGAPVRIGKRALDLLTAFVVHQGALLSKAQLIAHAWPDLVVGAPAAGAAKLVEYGLKANHELSLSNGLAWSCLVYTQGFDARDLATATKLLDELR